MRGICFAAVVVVGAGIAGAVGWGQEVGSTAVATARAPGEARESELRRVLTQYYLARFNAKDLLAKGQYEASRERAKMAKDLVLSNAGLFTDNDLRSLRDAAQSQYMQAEVLLQRANGRPAASQNEGQVDAAAEIRRRRVNALIADAQKLYDATQYKEAADLLRQATIIDPGNTHAALMLRAAVDRITDREYENLLRTPRVSTNPTKTSQWPNGGEPPFEFAAVAEGHTPETGALLIALEARVLLVSKTFFDDFSWGPEKSAATAIAAKVGTANDSSTFKARILDNWNLSLLLNATQADRRTVVGTSPRATLADGGRGTVTAIKTQRYVAGYEHDSTPGAAVEYVPREETVKFGFSMGVEATVTVDGRAMEMKLDLSKRVLVRMDREAEAGMPAEKGLMIDKPVVTTEEGKLTLAVPDGGTVLVDCGMDPVGLGKRMLVLMRPNVFIHTESGDAIFGEGNDRGARESR